MKLLYRFLLFCSTVLLSSNIVGQNQHIDNSINYAWEVKYSNPDTARYILNGIIDEGLNEFNAKHYAKAHSFLGVMEDIAGNGDKAVAHLLEALEIQEEKDFKKDLSFTYNNLGIAFFYQYNYRKALEYYSLSAAIDKKLGDENGAAGTLINIGIVYTYLDSLERARDMYQEADLIYKKENDSIGRTQVALNMAKIYFANKEFEKAIEFYDTALLYLKTNKDPELKLNAYHGMANVYTNMNEIDSALYYCNLSNSYSLHYNLRERLQYGYDLLSEIYIKNGDYENAFAALKKYTALRDSIVNEDRNQSIAEMQTKYETEKKDRVIAQMELDKVAKEKERNLFFAASVIFLLLVVLLTIAYRFNKRKNSLLKERNSAVEENLHQKETMIGEIHHRIKNNLQLITSIFDLQARTLKDEEAIKAIQDSINRVKAMAIIHQKLYQQSDIYGINMKEYLEDLTEGIVQTFNTVDQEITLNTDIEEVILHIDSSIPIGLIITEIITNSMKYAYPNQKTGMIHISLHEKENKLLLAVGDNGVGMHNAPSTETSTNFGTKMIKSLARQLRAEWTIATENGTKYSFEIIKFKRGEKK